MGRLRSWADRALEPILWLDTLLTYLFLYLPIGVLILYSFSASRYALVWGGFSLEAYAKLLTDPEIALALSNSVIVALVSTALATVLGTALALALERARLRFQGGVEVLVYLPIVIPEIVMAVGLLLFFAQVLRPLLSTLGLTLSPLPTVIVGHVAFSISYVMVVVRARLRDLDRSLEEAALDLGATPLQVLRKVTLPLLTPAIISGALLAFTLSLDDFYVTYFSTTGGSGFKTLPLYLYALQGRAAIPPQMNAAATVMLGASLMLIALALLVQRRGRRG
uniref:Ornithine carbamoyltransferase n=2 Tax=Candidatus Bipolaricaulota TaxID=67810 RepID=H5SJ67_9BACT|nr:ornithine carbamoyltransferase [uncultured Acetothermia bacterium]BAL59923.1 spermidine/putrescine transport system permease protein [Candidatus Acetothermum autotrophicum]